MFWRDAAHPRGLWRRTTLASYRTDAPDWDLLLDIDALAAAEQEDWVWAGAGTLPPMHDRALLRLSKGGGDAVVVREFDMATRAFVTDGFVLPESKGGVSWIDRDTVLLMTALSGATTSGYARQVQVWHRGVPWAEAPVVFAAGDTDMCAWAQFDRADGRFVFVRQTGFYDSEVHIGTIAGPTQHIDLPSDAWVLWDRNWLAVRGRTPWLAGGRTIGADVVVGIALDGFLAGSRVFTTVFEPGPRRSIQGLYWSDGALVLSILDDLKPVYTVVTPGTWVQAPLPNLPAVGTASAWPLDAEETEQDGTLLAAVQDPLTPARLLLLTGERADTLKQAPASFDAAGLIVTRHDAISVDGERIPYTQVGPPGLTGDAPVHMTAYGGFGISMLPSYLGGRGRVWLEPGGTCVVANIRGGG